MINLTDQELLARLRNFEDPFVERKSAGDHKDFIKTAVAFANTLPIGVPGVLFVPATNDGKIQAADLDDGEGVTPSFFAASATHCAFRDLSRSLPVGWQAESVI